LTGRQNLETGEVANVFWGETWGRCQLWLWRKAGRRSARRVRTLDPHLVIEVAKRSDATRGFRVLSHRWVVERTLGWLMRDCEKITESAEALVYLTLIRLRLRRLA
jgi:transposase